MRNRAIQLKRTLRIALSVLLLSVVGIGEIYASYDFSAVCPTGQTLYYNITDVENHYVELTCPGASAYSYDYWSGFTKPTGAITLPSTVDYNGVSYTVTSIGNNAFYYCTGLTGRLEITQSVTSIGDNAFYKCTGLTSVAISNSVTSIGEYAFAFCSDLTTVAIPNSVTSISNYMFYYCSDLTTVAISNSVTTIGSYAFHECRGLTSIVIPNSVTSIDSYAFSACTNLTSINIPNSVISIGNSAFNACRALTSIMIPCSVTFIGSSAFGECYNLEQIVVDPENTVYDSRNACNAIIKTNTNQLVTGCKNTVIPNSVTIIGDYAFYYCHGLTSIEIPNSVIAIGSNAFNDCYGLTSIEIPNSVTFIGSYAFRSCKGLTSIVIPNSVTSIGNFAFANCTGLTSVEIPNTITSIGNFTFVDCVGLTSIGIPNTVTSIGNSAFSNCRGLTSIALPNSVTSIGKSAFSNCTGLTSIVLPNSVTSIGSAAFSSCTGLTSIVLPNALTSISGSMFYGCTGLASIVIPNSVATIESYAFYRCTGLASVTIPNSVTSIGGVAFYSCTSLISVEIPNSVTFVGSAAFGYCRHLRSLTVLANNPPIMENDVFRNVNKAIPVYVRCASLLAYQNASGWDEFTNYIPVTECEPGEITVTANPTEGGLVSGAGFYEGGAICTLTATANTNYAFVNWTKEGEVVSDSEIYQFYADGDAAIVANFVAIPPTPVVAAYYHEPNGNNSVKVNWSPVSTVTPIGEGISTFNYFPFYTYAEYSIAENLFLAVELEEAGLISTPITSLSWYAVQTPENEQQGLSIWMANVSDTQLTSTSHKVSDMTLVYSGSMTPVMGWNEFVFNRGTFTWDGVSNVLIFCQRNQGSGDKTVRWQSANVGFKASSYNYSSIPTLDVNVANTMLTSAMRPNIIIRRGESTYNLYRANCDGTGVQTMAENLGETQYIDETWEQLGIGNYKYGVSVLDFPNSEIVWSNCIEKTGNEAVQTTSLSQGWNWYSTYIEQEDVDGLVQLENSIGIPNVTIQSRSNGYVKSVQKNGTTVWGGQLSTINNEEMYKIGTNEACTATMSGFVANPASHPITIIRGWNWIGFPCSESVSVSVALSGFSPKKNDMIKGRNGSAIYSNGTWSGTLNTLEPGQGYMYGSKSNAMKTLVFQTGSRGEATLANITPENNYYQPTEEYADNMTIIAVVELDSEELRSEDYELAAFAGDECRGSVKLMYVEPINRYVAFLTVFGDETEDLRFVLTDGIELSQSYDFVPYETDGIEGSLDSPVTLRFGTTDANVRVYPNPSEGIFNIEGSNIRRVEVFNALGQPVCTMETESGFTKLDLTKQSSGIYLIRVVTFDGVKSHQVMKR